MDILMHHIQPWMKKSIAQAEDRIEEKVFQQMEWKIQAIHQRLDVFEQRVLARPAPTIYLTTVQEVVGSLQTDVDSIVEIRGPYRGTAPFELAEDTVLASLFTTPTAMPSDPCERAQSHLSSCTTERVEAHARKKERIDL